MENLKNKPDVIIIGAGLTGLSMAHKLISRGKSVLVIDKNEHAGGVIQTKNQDGFIYETGPNTGVLSTPELVELLEDLKSDCTLAVANEKAKKRLILKNGKWHALPSGLFSAVGTPLFSLKDKFRILGEPFRAKGNNPHESLADLVRRRMGKSFLDYAIDPFIGGIYAGDPEKIVPKYALPKLYALEQDYGSFIKGAMKKAREPKDPRMEKVSRKVFAVKGGLSNLVAAMVKSVGDENIYLSIQDAKVSLHEGSYQTEFADNEGNKRKIISQQVVSTVGAYQLQNLFPFLTKETLAPIENLRYAAVTQAAVGYKKWPAKMPDSFGGLIPSNEQSRLLGILFPSAIFDDRAPQGGALLSVFMGGVRKPEVFNLSDEEIKATALKAIAETLNVSEVPDIFEIFRYKHAIPQYEASSKERLEAIEKIETQYPGLILAGNIRDGIGMADRVKQGFQIAENI